MKQTLEDYIRRDEVFRQAMLDQEGGIMKYWAEHPDSDFDTDLFDGYEKQIVEDYLQANKRNRAVRSMPADKLKWKSLSWYHHNRGKELKFYIDLRPELDKLPREVKEQADKYFIDYLKDNYLEYLRYAYPADIAPIEFYNRVIKVFGVGGLARDCMDYILKEHHHPEVWPKMKTVDVAMTEFYIEEYSAFISKEGYFKKLREGVREKLAGKNQDECRREAVKMMNSVRGFARMLYSSSETQIKDCTGDYKVDKKWLRGLTDGLAVAFRHDGYLKNGFYEYVAILNDIGRIWAARLLKEHSVDMHELEKETGVILYPVAESAQDPDGHDHGNYKYYVDKDFLDQLDDQCCIYDEKQAKEILDALRNKQPLEERHEDAKKYDSDFDHLKVWEDNPKLEYYLSEGHWNHHVNQLLYAYLTSRYKGNEVGVYINLALGKGENAFKIDYNQIYGVMFNEAYCFCHYVLTTPVPETNIGFLENKAESLCPDDAKLAKPIIAYNILVMTGLILCFANDKNNAVGRFLNRLSNYNHTHYFGDEFHHFEDYIKIGLNCVAGIMIDGQIHSPGKLRSGYDYKGQDEYLRKTLPWYRVSVEMFEKRVEKSNCKTNEIEKILNEILCKVEEQTEMIRNLEPRFIDTSFSKQTESADLSERSKPGAKVTKFADYVIDKAETDKVICIIKQKINKSDAKQTALVIIGGIEAGKIRRDVTAPCIEREFGVSGIAVKPHLTKYRAYKNGQNNSFSEEELKPFKDLFSEQ